ncbi:G1/S-specific cyclin-D2 isoform X2 [Eupeodes corollae]|uniref:G1/S-specific cyclin-D2 isoform X2 n=1 Tax=Eupeodes corollae TaxID=290404 RepID=UPI0024922C1F|nr:G1/S-specific cyclin-D2 isoform X2 [Eupeodes corollae]
MDLLCTEKVLLNDTDVLLNSYNVQTNGYAASVTTGGVGGGGGGGGGGYASADAGDLTTTTTTNSYASAAANYTHQLLISKNLEQVNTAVEDPVFLSDRCLENALKAEDKHPTVCSYFKTVQKDITPPMRKIVAEWMMEVCAEQKCQEEVVLLALIYMDRFLSTKSVLKNHLQILAAACLLLASKLREPSCRALTADLLVYYTDNSIIKHDLIQWELYVLSRLKWDLSSVTPLDFLELLLIRLPIRSNKCPDLNVEKVRQHAQAFISLAAKEHYFSIYSASTIAASSIAAALSGLNWHLRTGKNLRYLLNQLTDLTSVEQDYLQDCMSRMEQIFEEHSRNLTPYIVTMDAQQHQHHHSMNETVANDYFGNDLKNKNHRLI